MTAQHKFVQNQDRSFFNIHKPVRLQFDDVFPEQNTRAPLGPTSEVDRQTGSGMKRPPMANNYDPSVKPHTDKVYLYSQQYQTHQPVMNRINNPVKLQNGAGSYAHLQGNSVSNPAVNNWLPGSNRPEPTRVYEHSGSLKLHSRPIDPIIIRPNIGGKQQGKLSMDDGKPFAATSKYFGTFVHVPTNPLVIKG